MVWRRYPVRERRRPVPTSLPVNSFDLDAIMATFARDAYVNDNRREFVGIDAVRR
jgi:hypothetical protein